MAKIAENAVTELLKGIKTIKDLVKLTCSPISAFFSIPTMKEDAPFSLIFTENDLVSEAGQFTVLTLIESNVTGT